MYHRSYILSVSTCCIMFVLQGENGTDGMKGDMGDPGDTGDKGQKGDQVC